MLCPVGFQARLDVAGADQQPGEVVQPGIVADEQQRAHARLGLLHQREDAFDAGIVEALLVGHLRPCA